MMQYIYSGHLLDEEGNPAGGKTTGCGIEINWQNGPLGRGSDRKEPNGAFVEGVINAAIDRINFYQNSKFRCEDNAEALKHLYRAVEYLQKRTKNREDREVEGTHSI